MPEASTRRRARLWVGTLWVGAIAAATRWESMSAPDEVPDRLALDFGALAEEIRRTYVDRCPGLVERYGERGIEHLQRDMGQHLRRLVDALAAGEVALFTEYMDWVRTLLTSRGVLDRDLIKGVEIMRDAVVAKIDGVYAEQAREYISAAIDRLHAYPDAGPPSDGQSPLAELADAYLAALLAADQRRAIRLVVNAVDTGGVAVRDLYLHVFQRTQHEIGQLWHTNQISVGQEHYCTAATQVAMAQLYPRILGVGSPTHERVFVGVCVQEELHELGVRMVCDFLEMAGWRTYYYGASMPDESVARAVREHSANVLGVSATMMAHVDRAKSLIETVRAANADGGLGVLAGGRPFLVAPRLRVYVGADAVARDAAEAVAEAARVAGLPPPR